MNDFIAARSQMAIFPFHIYIPVSAWLCPFYGCIPLQWIKTGQPVYALAAQPGARALLYFFMTGAVSGTIPSFELGLL